MTTEFGLYAHIPYCRALCHYCDFAKTAHFGEREAGLYWAQMKEHVRLWLDLAERSGLVHRRSGKAPDPRFSSVFFGGGTPSLFTSEYAEFMEILLPWVKVGAEVSLEANPDDISDHALKVWQELGFTRLSLGVQTFHERGLGLMKRIHDARVAETAIAMALPVFSNLNIDLIYGWPTQTKNEFRQDLEQAIRLKIPHLSVYTLTFESRTPLGRAAHRGALTPHSDDDLAEFYELACDVLKGAGYDHEEVSNWSLPGASCRHNWLYWDDASFIGVGPGAHGYLPSHDPQGIRYAYPRSDRSFLKRQLDPLPESIKTFSADEIAKVFGVEVEKDRGLDVWLMEYVGSSLRTKLGTDLSRIEARLGRSFCPSPALKEALEQGLCVVTPSGDGSRTLRFTPAEWFREVAWSVEVLRSFPDP